MLVRESYTNEYGQVINVGDPIMYMGTAWSYTAHRQGTFGGCYYDDKNHQWAVRVENIKCYGWVLDKESKTRNYTLTTRIAVLPLKRVFKLETPK